jgi:tRNA pseudouridine38/39 synthase
MKDGWLDIEAMRKAAKMYEGLHDFRNFCKVDGGKQIENFERRIFKADIEEVVDGTQALNYLNGQSFLPSGVSDGNPKVYTFTLHGSAFLWHQVRCMVAVLFLVAQRLEKPEIVRELLDVTKHPRRPIYEMATDTPLVLWDCIFPATEDGDQTDALDWIHVGSTPGTGDLKYGTSGLMESLWKTWRERKIDEMLAASLIEVVAKQGLTVDELTAGRAPKGSGSQKVFDGSDKAKMQGVYTPIEKKEKMDSVETINEKYAVRKGFKNSKDMKEQGFRRLGGKGSEKEELGEDDGDE